jgi:hypothetical protein
MSIESVLRQHEERLMALPNVTGVGVGQKAGKEVITVLVTQKVPESALLPDEVVPKMLDGVETDVVESGVITAHQP